MDNGGRRVRFVVRGASMYPTLRDGDVVEVDPEAFASRAPRPGELVLVKHPFKRDVLMVKRVAAVTDDGRIDVRGDAFLKNMVRILAGTLVAVGRGQFGVERIDEAKKDASAADDVPRKAAREAPPQPAKPVADVRVAGRYVERGRFRAGRR